MRGLSDGGGVSEGWSHLASEYFGVAGIGVRTP